MIEESYVSFDTARLLKEAGFEEKVNSCFMYDKYADKDEYEFEGSYAIVRKALFDNYNCYENAISRPTQALAARWLRETHDIHVFSFFEYARKKWCYGVSDTTAFCAKEGMDMPDECFLSCEEAFEVGLQYGLKLIKK